MDNKIVLIFVLLVLSVQGIGGTPHDKSKGCPNCRILPNEDDPVKRSSQACFCEAIRKVLETHCGGMYLRNVDMNKSQEMIDCALLVEGCPPCRSVRLTGVSALQGCLPYRSVRLTGVSILHWCPPFRDDRLTGVSTLQGCPPYRDGHPTGVSALQGWPPYRGVCLTGLSAIQGCPTYREIDECSSSPCKNNGVCKNIVGGFECSCSAGYEGPRCEKDIDECAHGSHDCLPNLATCVNTAGSYNCVCNNGYVGDGKKSCQPEECQIYQNLSSADRKVTSGIGNNTCDSGLGPGWFRFEGSAGSRMPTSCPPRSRCGTYGPGWMNGKHPTVDDGKVSRKVCFNWMSCCRFSTNVQVRNCGSYYVYYLGHTPTCNLRYCGSD